MTKLFLLEVVSKGYTYSLSEAQFACIQSLLCNENQLNWSLRNSMFVGAARRQGMHHAAVESQVYPLLRSVGISKSGWRGAERPHYLSALTVSLLSADALLEFSRVT